MRQRTRLQGAGEKRAGDNASPLRSRGFAGDRHTRRAAPKLAEEGSGQHDIARRFRGVLAQLLIGESDCFQGDVST